MSPFRTVLLFFIIGIAGFSLMPFLSANLLPSRAIPALTVTYGFADAPE
jgi:hypothetical protein